MTGLQTCALPISFRGRVRERFGTARVAEHHLVPGRDGEPRDGTADLSASDESHSCHILSVPSEDPFAGLVVIRVPAVSWWGSSGRCPDRRAGWAGLVPSRG